MADVGIVENMSKETSKYEYQNRITERWVFANPGRVAMLLSPMGSLDEPVPSPSGDGMNKGDMVADESTPFDEIVAGADNFGRLISIFDDRTKRMMIMRFGLQYTHEEIAQRFGLKPGSVRATISKAVGRLREQVA